MRLLDGGQGDAEPVSSRDNPETGEAVAYRPTPSAFKGLSSSASEELKRFKAKSPETDRSRGATTRKGK